MRGRTQIADGGQELAEVLPVWRALVSRRGGQHIEQHPEWLAAEVACGKTPLVVVLYRDGEAVGVLPLLQARCSYYYSQIGYDRAWAAGSPGKVLLYRLLEDLFAHDGPDRLDFGHGESEYKRIFGTEAYDSARVYLVRRALYTGTALTAQRTVTSASCLARQVLDRLRLREKVRHLLRG